MKPEHLYFIREYAEDYFFHGGIGIIDAERILIRQGFKPIRLPFHFNFSLKAKVARLLYSWKTFITLPDNAIVVFLFPLHARLAKWLIKMLSNRKSIRIICFIGDINGLKDGNERLLKKELKELKRFRFFIVHNQGMLDWLHKIVPDCQTGKIEFFDFLSSPVMNEHTKDNLIVFAGNLAKSKFLGHLQTVDLHFNLYGPGITHQILEQSNIEYKGIFDPYEMPEIVQGSFGLVWDGDSAEGIQGSLGHYMQYISHHKLSLYILAGLPVITSCSAGSAELVSKYKIGFCVNNLHEISARIKEIDEQEYKNMVNNLQKLAKRISEGNCLAGALQELMKRMD
jgi:glycosyltransferase involved in cell wall biosynthesis